MDYDEELHKAWVDACMDVANDFAEEYCNMQCDGTRSHLEAATAHRTKLRNMLWDVPTSMALTDSELRAGVELQRKEIDRLKQQLRDEGDRISELRGALHSLAAVARRYLPDYDEHPEIQKADEALVPNDRVERPGAASGDRSARTTGCAANGTNDERTEK